MIPVPEPAPKSSILEGKVEDFPLPDILQVLQVSGKSGALFLRRPEGAHAVITFRGGQIVQALASEEYQTLGDRLVARGAITQEDLEGSLQYLAHFPGMRLGDALVERGFVTRPQVEDEVKSQMAETIDRLVRWGDAAFEFRMGVTTLRQGLSEFALDFVLERGVEPRHILLEASLLEDHRARDSATSMPAAKVARPVPPPPKTEPDDDDASRIVRWFDGEAQTPPDADHEINRFDESFLSVTEELQVAQGRGELGLLLLRYASELFAHGGLLMRERSGFRVLGQFGEAFWWDAEPAEPVTFFDTGSCPLLDKVAEDGRPLSGFVVQTETGGLAPADVHTEGAVAALTVPLHVLGKVSLILFCRSAIAGAPDARALIALARQVAVTLENTTLRELAKRSGPV